MKTAEQILSEHTGEKGIYLTHGTIRGSDAISAMEEYANQFKQEYANKNTVWVCEHKSIIYDDFMMDYKCADCGKTYFKKY